MTLEPWTWWTSVPSFIKIVRAVKKLNSIFRARLNFRRRPFLCTTLYRNPTQAGNFGGTFDQLFLWFFFMKFSQKTPLYFFHTFRLWKTTTKSLDKNWKIWGITLEPWTWWTSVPSFIKIVRAVKKLNSIFRARLNFRRRPFLCTTLYRNPTQAGNFGGTFDQLFLWFFFMKFSQKMPLYFFHTMVQKSQKWPKTEIKGSCLKAGPPWGYFSHLWSQSLKFFFVWKLLKKNEKWHHFCAHVQWWWLGAARTVCESDAPTIVQIGGLDTTMMTFSIRFLREETWPDNGLAYYEALEQAGVAVPAIQGLSIRPRAVVLTLNDVGEHHRPSDERIYFSGATCPSDAGGEKNDNECTCICGRRSGGRRPPKKAKNLRHSGGTDHPQIRPVQRLSYRRWCQVRKHDSKRSRSELCRDWDEW